MRWPERVISLAELSGSVWRVAAAMFWISGSVMDGAAVSVGTRRVAVFGAAFFTAARFFCSGRGTLTAGICCGSAAGDCANAPGSVATVSKPNARTDAEINNSRRNNIAPPCPRLRFIFRRPWLGL
jgi:hypothetical protein